MTTSIYEVDRTICRGFCKSRRIAYVRFELGRVDPKRPKCYNFLEAEFKSEAPLPILKRNKTV